MAFEKVINKINVLSVFDGISAGRLALQRANIEVNTYYRSEIDKHASKVAMSHFPNDVQLGDVTKWREWDLDWSNIDLFIGGSPCQGFSFAGKQAGTKAEIKINDEIETILVTNRNQYLELKQQKENGENISFLSQSYLFWEYVLLLDHIKQHNPKVKFLLENVKMKKELLQMIDSALGVESVVINSNLLSAQNRHRHYWANFPIIAPKEKQILIENILENTCGIKDQDNIISGAIRGRYNQDGTTSQRLEPNYTKKTNALTTVAKDNVLILDLEKKEYRNYTPLECERLQTLPENYTHAISKTQRLKSIGNGWTVDIIAHIFKELKVELIKEGKLSA